MNSKEVRMSKENQEEDQPTNEHAGLGEQPEIFSVQKGVSGIVLNRRSFLGASAIGLLAACARPKQAIKSDDSSNSFKKIKKKESTAPKEPDKPKEPEKPTIKTRPLNTDCGIAHSDRIRCLAISSDGKVLVSGSDDKTLKTWSFPDGKLLKTLKGHTHEVASLAISPDSKNLASGSYDKSIKIWSLPKGKLLRTLKGHSGHVDVLAISNDGKLLVSGGDDKTIKFWSLPEGKLLNTITDNPGPLTCLAISPDGKLLASVSNNNVIRLLSFPDGKLDMSLEGHTGIVQCVTFSSDGNILASGSDDKTIKLWNIPERKNLTTLKGSSRTIYSMVFGADGKTLVAGSSDNSISVWSVGEGRLTVIVNDKSSSTYSVATPLAISPDGTTLTTTVFALETGKRDAAIKLWSFPEIESLGCVFDEALTAKGTIIKKYRQMGQQSFTQPCGTLIPTGAICTCNCVAGSLSFKGSETVCICDTISIPSSQSFPNGAVCVCNTISVGSYKRPIPEGHKRTMSGTICSCDTICTCNTVGGGRGYGGHYWRPN